MILGRPATVKVYFDWNLGGRLEGPDIISAPSREKPRRSYASFHLLSEFQKSNRPIGAGCSRTFDQERVRKTTSEPGTVSIKSHLPLRGRQRIKQHPVECAIFHDVHLKLHVPNVANAHDTGDVDDKLLGIGGMRFDHQVVNHIMDFQVECPGNKNRDILDFIHIRHEEPELRSVAGPGFVNRQTVYGRQCNMNVHKHGPESFDCSSASLHFLVRHLLHWHFSSVPFERP